MKFKNNLRFKIGIALILVVVVLVWQLLLSLKSHQRLTNADYARKSGAPLPVSMVEVQSGKLDSIIAAECIAKESARVVLSTGIAGGSIVSINTKVGDTVSQDQLLVKLDDAVLKDELQNTQEAELIVGTLKDELKLFVSDIRKLRKKSLVPVMDLLDAIDRQRRAELDLTRIRREKINVQEGILDTEIVAPISGVLTSMEVDIGTTLRPNEEVVVVSRLDPLWIECEFAEDMLPAVSDYDSADASFPAHHGKAYAVEIEKILPSADEETHAIVAQFNLANKEQALLPGMRAVVRLSKLVEDLRIPSICLINPNGDSANIFVVDKNEIAHFVKIGIGRYAEGFVEVKSGLKSGQRVVIVGQASLQDGDTVRGEVIESTDAGNIKVLFPVTSR